MTLSAATDSDLARALERFAGELGQDAVAGDPQALQAFRDPFPLGDPDEFRAAGILSPSSVEEVRTIVRLANELGVALWPVSRGRNNAYGGPSPRKRGSFIVELSRMDRVLEVDEDSALAVVEPGVRFFDLYDHLRAHGHRLWVSVADLGWGSVLGNGLDRGMGYTAYGDHAAMQCGLEVVLPDGDLVRTGMGAMSHGAAWHLYAPGFGPAVDGLFRQSNLGIVTRGGVWLMPTPEVFTCVDVVVSGFDDLEPLVDALRPLKLDGTIEGSAAIREPMLATSKLDARSRFYDGAGPAPEEAVQEMMRAHGLGRWTLSFAVYGSEARVAADLQAIRRAFARVPGAEVLERTYAGSVGADDVALADRTRAGIPGMYSETLPDWRASSPGSGRHVCFSPVLPLSGRLAIELATRLREIVEGAGFDYIGTYHVGKRHLSHVVEIIWDGTEDVQTAAARGVFGELLAAAAELGYGEYRTHIAFMDQVAAQFDFNDHALLRLQRKLKDAMDPNGILAPGKSGIWSGR